MSARIASGLRLEPEVLLKKRTAAAHLSIPDEHLAVARKGMDLVVNGAGTAVASRLPLEGVKMAGKTGTAQVKAIKDGFRGKGGVRKFRDHGLFVCYAPVENPRYAASVVIEHGMGGARAAAPVAKDVLTFLYDKEKAMAALEAFEAGWGGNIQERMDRQYAEFLASQGAAP